jgi:osmotically-inducible protein OsmY
MLAAARKTETPTVAKKRQRILVVGNTPRRLDSVQSALEPLKAKIERTPWVAGLFDTLDRSTLGVVMVPRLPGTRLAHAVRACRGSDWGRTGGVFVVLFDDSTDRRVRSLYKAGATAVLEWPRDAVLFASLVAETKGIEQARGKATDADAALGRSVRARLRLACSMPSELRVSCRDGVVHAAGPINGLWLRSLVAEHIGRVPGVRQVVTEGLFVPNSGLPDVAVSRAVRGLLRTMPTAGEESLSANVERGFVTLAGSISSRRDLDDVLRAISDLRGVRGIENLVVVSPQQRGDDRAVARRLQGAVSRLFPDEEVTVKVFGGVAVLQGTVAESAARRRVEAIVAADEDADRVINKLTVG